MYGACRVGHTDYMYQGGCGELSQWGRLNIYGEEECTVWNRNVKQLHLGVCSTEGHCVDHQQAVSYNNPHCAAIMIRRNVTSSMTSHQDRVFHTVIGLCILSSTSFLTFNLYL